MAHLPAFAANNEAVGQTIQEFFDSGLLEVGNQKDDERLVQIFSFYESRNFKPMWTRNSGPKFKAKDMLAALKSADEHGLDPKDYDIEGIQSRMDAEHPETLAELELIISDSFSQYAHHLSAGRVKPSAVNSAIKLYPQAPAPLSLINGAEAADSVAAYIEKIKPQTPRYDRLKEGLARYRKIASEGGWPLLPDGPTLKPGMEDARIPTLRKMLVVMGDLDAGSAGQGTLYDDALVTGVKRFQERHGRDQDGVIGPSTIKAMQIPVEKRVEQMVINLERRRWMEDDFGDYYIFVNLADQNLKVVQKKGGREKTIHVTRVVVGKPYHSTPVFSKDMRYVVFNPYWNVPTSIANKEYLPKLRQNPGALNGQKIRLLASSGAQVDPYSVDWRSVSRVPYRLRQDSGPGNALGQIKFMFPNKFNIYIHDTPSKSLFAKEIRYFSHGCIRVQNPDELADVLLRRQGWSKSSVDAQIGSMQRRIVNLKKRIPVHISYLTSWVNKDGSIHFRRDVYGRDKKLAKFMLRK
ncbi:MAG: L,D-transpeptidase family protein [Hyphomicrobiales bacterium]